MVELPALSVSNVPHRASVRIAEVEVDEAVLLRAWGPRHAAHGWSWRAACGVEQTWLEAADGRWFICSEEPAELDHVLAHLPFEVNVRWRAEEGARQGWVVSRLDSSGIRFELVALRRESSARCYADRLEARRHKQSYFVELRGEAPPPPPFPSPAAGFTLFRQDDNGQVFEVLRDRQDVLEALAARLSAESRHKQLYFVTATGAEP